MRCVEYWNTLSNQSGGESLRLLIFGIKSAFSSVRRTDKLRLLEESGLEHYLLGLIDDYHRNRSIILHDVEHFYNVGMPRGSCLGSVLLVVINILYKQLTKEETGSSRLSLTISLWLHAARFTESQPIWNWFSQRPTTGLLNAIWNSATVVQVYGSSSRRQAQKLTLTPYPGGR